MNRYITGHRGKVLYEAGQEHCLKFCSMHSITSCRIKKAFHYFGYAIIPEDDVLKTGFGFSVKTDKLTITKREAVLA